MLCYFLSPYVITTPTMRAITVNPWAAIRVRIMICDILRLPVRKLYRPAVRAAVVARQPVKMCNKQMHFSLIVYITTIGWREQGPRGAGLWLTNRHQRVLVDFPYQFLFGCFYLDGRSEVLTQLNPVEIFRWQGYFRSVSHLFVVATKF